MALICGSVVVLGLMYKFADYSQDKTNIKSEQLKMNSFHDRFQNIKDLFPSQDVTTWSRIKAPVGRVVSDDNPEYPAILVFLYNSKNEQTTNCLTQLLASTITEIYNPESHEGKVIDIPALKLPTERSSTVKLDFDGLYHDYFSGEAHVVTIKQLEKLGK